METTKTSKQLLDELNEEYPDNYAADFIDTVIWEDSSEFPKLSETQRECCIKARDNGLESLSAKQLLAVLSALHYCEKVTCRVCKNPIPLCESAYNSDICGLCSHRASKDD